MGRTVLPIDTYTALPNKLQQVFFTGQPSICHARLIDRLTILMFFSLGFETKSSGGQENPPLYRRR
jgi:hypothetical protein